MAGMKRFVTYIYAYEDGKKSSNAGFAKIEVRGNDCRIEIHLRGIYAWRAVGRVCLFRNTGEKMEGVQIGEIRPVNGSGNLAVIVKADNINASSIGIGDMEGIFVLSEDDRIFMSRWREGEPLEVVRERLVVRSPETVSEKKTEETAADSREERDPKASQDTGAGEGTVKTAGSPSPQRGRNGAAGRSVQRMGGAGAAGQSSQRGAGGTVQNRGMAPQKTGSPAGGIPQPSQGSGQPAGTSGPQQGPVHQQQDSGLASHGRPASTGSGNQAPQPAQESVRETRRSAPLRRPPVHMPQGISSAAGHAPRIVPDTAAAPQEVSPAAGHPSRTATDASSASQKISPAAGHAPRIVPDTAAAPQEVAPAAEHPSGTATDTVASQKVPPAADHPSRTAADASSASQRVPSAESEPPGAATNVSPVPQKIPSAVSESSGAATDRATAPVSVPPAAAQPQAAPDAANRPGQASAVSPKPAPDAARSSPGEDVPHGEPAEQPARQSGGQPGNEAVRATEIPMRNILPGYDWQAIWEDLTESHPLFTPFDDRETVCIQLELRELRDLPKRYWYLGNNSFLLHGFFNYRYLVVGQTGEGRWFLGVPGVYQRQERVMAAIFGFPEFVPTAASEGEEKAEEPVNRFGCWYRYIEE